MGKIQLSKSKYCRAKQCNKILWMDKYKPEERKESDKESIFETGNKVGECAKSLFGPYIDIEFSKNLSDMIIKTKEALENKPNIICEASFEFENNFCSVDILKNEEDGLEIYEVKSSGEVKSIYLDDIAFQYYILSKLGYTIKKACLVYLNTKYVRHGTLELDKLFLIEDLTQIAKEKLDEVENKIKEIDSFMEENKEEPEKQIGMQCQDPYDCEYWSYCTKNLPENNIFKIRGMHWNKKFEYYYMRKRKF